MATDTAAKPLGPSWQSTTKTTKSKCLFCYEEKSVKSGIKKDLFEISSNLSKGFSISYPLCLNEYGYIEICDNCNKEGGYEDLERLQKEIFQLEAQKSIIAKKLAFRVIDSVKSRKQIISSHFGGDSVDEIRRLIFQRWKGTYRIEDEKKMENLFGSNAKENKPEVTVTDIDIVTPGQLNTEFNVGTNNNTKRPSMSIIVKHLIKAVPAPELHQNMITSASSMLKAKNLTHAIQQQQQQQQSQSTARIIKRQTDSGSNTFIIQNCQKKQSSTTTNNFLNNNSIASTSTTTTPPTTSSAATATVINNLSSMSSSSFSDKQPVQVSKAKKIIYVKRDPKTGKIYRVANQNQMPRPLGPTFKIPNGSPIIITKKAVNNAKLFNSSSNIIAAAQSTLKTKGQGIIEMPPLLSINNNNNNTNANSREKSPSPTPPLLQREDISPIITNNNNKGSPPKIVKALNLDNIIKTAQIALELDKKKSLASAFENDNLVIGDKNRGDKPPIKTYSKGPGEKPRSSFTPLCDNDDDELINENGLIENSEKDPEIPDRGRPKKKSLDSKVKAEKDLVNNDNNNKRGSSSASVPAPEQILSSRSRRTIRKTYDSNFASGKEMDKIIAAAVKEDKKQQQQKFNKKSGRSESMSEESSFESPTKSTSKRKANSNENLDEIDDTSNQDKKSKTPSKKIKRTESAISLIEDDTAVVNSSNALTESSDDANDPTEIFTNDTKEGEEEDDEEEEEEMTAAETKIKEEKKKEEKIEIEKINAIISEEKEKDKKKEKLLEKMEVVDDEEKIEKKFVCVFCPNAFATLSDKIEHEVFHAYNAHPKTNPCFQCEICQEVCNEEENLLEHRKAFHEGTDIFTCIYCGIEFRSKRNFNTHVLSHYEERKHQCDLCGKRFKKGQHLADHKRTHTGEAFHKCTDCYMAFATFSRLSHHRNRYHSTFHPFKCLRCGQTFPKMWWVRQHQKSQLVAANVICKICNEVFRWKCALAVHSKGHNGDYIKKCLPCSSSFLNEISWMNHLTEKHDGLEPVESAEVEPEQNKQLDQDQVADIE